MKNNNSKKVEKKAMGWNDSHHENVEQMSYNNYSDSTQKLLLALKI